jgi:hypothetical protein
VLRIFEISICNGFSLSLPDSNSKLARDTGGEEVAERMLEIVVEDISAALRERAKRPPEVPPYFDRYITAEISHLSAQIVHLREDIFKEFGVLREEMDGRFGALREEMDMRFGALQGEMERRFVEMDKRFGAFREEMRREIDRLKRWFFAFGVPIILGILAIIIKIFFMP